MSKSVIKQILLDGEFHSGEALGEAAGISRAAVWKAIKKLEDSGLQLESVKGKGYRWVNPLPPLEQYLIEQGFVSEAEQIAELHCLDEVGSTNRFALERLSGAAGAVICCAERQTAGKGRRGREWVSPYGRNIYLSVAYPFEGGAKVLEGLSLAVGVVVADVLKSLGINDVGLKWPNDIWVGQKKIAGILIELSGDADGLCHAVIGLGLNVAMQESEAASAIDQAWTDCQTEGVETCDRNIIIVNILQRLLPLLAQFAQQDFSVYQQRFDEYDIFKGKPVYIKLGSKLVMGESLGVDAGGALRLKTENGVEVFSGGEVSLRAANAL